MVPAPSSTHRGAFRPILWPFRPRRPKRKSIRTVLGFRDAVVVLARVRSILAVLVNVFVGAAGL
jgi:hypothetical protein